MTIIERILETADKKGIKQNQIAQATGKDKSVVTNWRKRNCNPPAEYIPAIAQLLNVSLEWLITGSETPALSYAFSEDKQRLLTYYDQCNQEGKERIIEQAEFIAGKYPKTGNLSEYKIG